ncbi:MAG: DUF4405 domain-containing protein [Crenarchaeota archaeon]|nr:DUF4405 domain-containing protein [Thermoproteota archaeon]
MSSERVVRAATSIVLFFSWLLTIFSGTILLLKSSVALYQYVPLSTDIVADIHTYAGFVMFGSSIIHVYLNRRAVLAYLKRIVGKV